jgi:hypothetical protein
MLNRAVRAGIVSICLSMIGCVAVPLVSSIYEPHGPGQIVISDPGGAGRQVSLRSDLEGGATIYIGADMPTKDYATSRLRVALTLRPLQQARFDTPAVLIRTLATSESQSIAIGELTVDYRAPPRSVEESSSEVMDGGPLAEGKVQGQTAFRFSIDLPFATPQDFTAALPAICFVEHCVQIEPIHFTVERQGHVAIIGVKS